MINSNIKQIMEKRKITIRALCSTTNLSLETICRARDERLVSCTVATLEAIAKALGVKVKDLFDEIPDPPAGERQAAGLAKTGGNGYCPNQEGPECL